MNTECKCEIRRCHLCDGIEVDKYCVNKSCHEYKKYEEDLPRWDVACGELKGGGQISKARKLNRLKRIEESAMQGTYIILPIEGYNKTTYLVDANAESCTCQFNVRANKLCSHIMGVFLYIKLNGESFGGVK